MNTIKVLEFFLTIFAIYLPLYLGFLLYLNSKVKRYSIGKCVVSLLATAPKPWNQFFNLSTSVYGLLGTILPISLLFILNLNLLSVTGIFVLFLVCLSTILVGFFPMNKNLKKHERVSYVVFSTVFVVGMIFAYIFERNDIFPEMIQIINTWVIFNSILLFISFLMNKRADPNPLFEWMTLISTIIWNFILAISLIKLF